MTKHEQDTFRSAVDTINALKNRYLTEPNEQTKRALVQAVKHYNQLGYIFTFTKEMTICRRRTFLHPEN
jgi:hypothetical protein